MIPLILTNRQRETYLGISMRKSLKIYRVREVKFAICILGEEDGDLELWKLYRVLPDSKANEVECLRVIDESGEDYLYPKNQFIFLELLIAVQEKLLSAIEE